MSPCRRAHTSRRRRQYPTGMLSRRQPAPARIAGLTLSMLRYRVAIMVWTFMLLGAASGDGARLKAGELALEACALAWSYVAATTVNDLADVEIDLVNHPGDAGRPLVSGAAYPADMRRLHWLAWAAAIGCAAPLGLVPAMLVVVGLVIGRAYSLRPLRLSYRPYSGTEHPCHRICGRAIHLGLLVLRCRSQSAAPSPSVPDWWRCSWLASS